MRRSSTARDGPSGATPWSPRLARVMSSSTGTSPGRGRPALVGWSVITGPLSVAQNYTWMPQGTRGRARGVPTVGLGWRMPCTGYTALDSAHRRRGAGRRVNDQFKAVAEELKARVRGATYFPFTFYRPGEIRSSQSYLTKFPCRAA